ncbi:MAG: protein kinase [Isosphaeraceae bacterium]
MSATVEREAPEPCPSPSRLRGFLQGELPPPEIDAVARHLESCPACREEVTTAGIVADPLERDPLQLRGTRGSSTVDRGLIREIGAAPEGTARSVDTNPDPSGAESSRYEVLRKHDAGGLGQVLVALDRQFGREVALKEVLDREGGASRSALSRFEREARVTGRLEHPGIVPVHSLGRHPDGRPYYVMKLIRGEDLRSAVKRFHAGSEPPGRRSLEFLGLLRRFLDVCETVAYAHEQGVIHRDLKPRNVMLGPFGETLVIDWGLAKVSRLPASGIGGGDPPAGHPNGIDESGESPTDPEGPHSLLTPDEQVLGTPGFMSPEQARGDGDQVGPLSDVYSLGATLYVLLTNRAPFDTTDRPRYLEQVQVGDFPPPRKVDPRVDPGLEAICLKAMATSPGDRYPNAQALAADMERWLADEPILARRDSIGVRAWRWARRHRVLTSSGVAMLTVGVIALSILARVEATHAAELSRKDAESDGWLNEALDAFGASLDGVITGGPESAGPTSIRPGAEPPWSDRAMDFYRRLVESYQSVPSSDRRGRLRLYKGHASLAGLFRHLGRRDAAASEFIYALNVARDLESGSPNDLALKKLSATALANLAVIQAETKRGDEARRTYEAAIERLNVFDDPDGRHRAAQLTLAKTLMSFANLLSMRYREFGEAESRLARAIGLFKRLERTAPGEPHARSASASALNALGKIYWDTKRYTLAEPTFRRALEIHRPTVERPYPPPKSREDFARVATNLGLVLDDLARPDEADALFQLAYREIQALVDTYPDVPRYKFELVRTRLNHASLLSRSEREKEAEVMIQQALEETRTGLGLPPLQQRSILASLLMNLGNTLARNRKFEDAETHWREAIGLRERTLRERPGDADVTFELGRTWFNVGLSHVERDRGDLAVDDFTQALARLRGVIHLPGDRSFERGLFIDVVDALAPLLAAGPGRDQVLDLIEERIALAPRDGRGLYGSARILAICAGRVTDPRLRQLLADRAFELLERAAEAGWDGLAAALNDPDLKPLWGREDFQRLRGILMDRAFPNDPFAP